MRNKFDIIFSMTNIFSLEWNCRIKGSINIFKVTIKSHILEIPELAKFQRLNFLSKLNETSFLLLLRHLIVEKYFNLEIFLFVAFVSKQEKTRIYTARERNLFEGKKFVVTKFLGKSNLKTVPMLRRFSCRTRVPT